MEMKRLYVGSFCTNPGVWKACAWYPLEMGCIRAAVYSHQIEVEDMTEVWIHVFLALLLGPELHLVSLFLKSAKLKEIIQSKNAG